jgi:uncharacterized protein Yka (UPF0111/DUF47 family)
MLREPLHAARFFQAIRKVECEADEIDRKLRARLETSLAVPFEIGDVYALSIAFREIIRRIGRVARWTASSELRIADPAAQELAVFVVRITHGLQETAALSRTPRAVLERVPFLDLLAKWARSLHVNAISKLLQSRTEALTAIKFKGLYDRLNTAIEVCASTACTLERIALKEAPLVLRS